MSPSITIRKTQTKLIDTIVDHGSDFKLWYDQSDVLHAGSKDIPYPMDISREQFRHAIPRGERLSCDEQGKCILSEHINKFYSFTTSASIIAPLIAKRQHAKKLR